MKFKIKPKPIHYWNDKRIKRKFAFIPVQIHDEYIWLEFYYELQTYRNHFVYGIGWHWKSRSQDKNIWDIIK
jgi:hypothetical protein